MNTKRLFLFAVVATVTIALMIHPALAKQFMVGERPLNLFGYITQEVAFSLDDDSYDTEEGLQSALFNLFLEGDYTFTDDLRFYGAGMLTVDWIYDIKHDDRSWNDKLFTESRDNLYIDDESWQLLKEAHFTWTPGDFYFRVGKQIVAWGETDGFRLMDQINPLDQRRGFADVEFETSIIPIWLLRAEYFPPISTGWLQDLGFEFIFNPNADFIPNQLPASGNDAGGIWAPNIAGPFPFANDPFFGLVPYPIYLTLPVPPATPGLPPIPSRIGSADMALEEPDSWDSDGYEYGFRIKGIINDAIITLNYFDGLDNDPVLKAAAAPPTFSLASDGSAIVHPKMEGYYPDFRFAGVTFSRDITPLKASFLGGVAPVLRLETFYGFDTTFATSLNTLEKSDELRWAIGIDWKVKIPFLNPRTYFTISPQFYQRKILDYPSGYEFSNLEDDNNMTTLMISTSYFHNKLVPSFFWMHDITNEADMYKVQLVYDYSYKWHYTLGALILNGEEPGKGFDVFENKDQIYFKISYKWG
jgi:hypothetical protein